MTPNPDALLDGRLDRVNDGKDDARDTGDAKDGPAGAGGAAGADGAAGMGASGMDGAAGQGDAAGAGGADAAAGSGGAGGADGGDAPVSDTAIDRAPDGQAPLDAVVDLGVPADVAETNMPPAAPTALTAAVADRRQTSFQLSWVAPAASWGGRVNGYQVRYSRSPITMTTFDDAAISSPAPYVVAPAQPGQPDGVLVSNLNIESDYYFAVAAVDAFGNRGPLIATTTATKASFQVTLLSGTGTDNAGFDLDGSADLGTSGTLAFTADGRSDLIVGATAATHVYVYFGTPTGYSTTPSITITGSVTGFGRSVANAGDLDGDGLADIAVASPNDNGGRVYVFSRKNPPVSWGTTGTWPAALTDAQANYVIGSTGALAGRALARLGDFDGAGGDDLAIGFQAANTLLGSVTVVKGGATFASRTLPDTTNTIRIDGVTAGGAFGAASLGIGKFLPSAGTTMIVTASIAGTSYAFGGHAVAGGVMTAAAADDSTAGSGTDRYGIPIAYLGPLTPSPGAIGLVAVQGKYVDFQLGTSASGPFLGAPGSAPAPSVRFTDSVSGNSFGVIAIGSGVRGTTEVKSFIGNALPDLVLAGQGEADRPLYIVSGTALMTLSGTVDVSMRLPGDVPGIVKVPARLPADWANGFTTGTLINDLDGNGYADFAVGEFSSAAPGRVAVFY